MVSLIFSSGGYINGRNSANLELLIDKTSLIYLYVKLKPHESSYLVQALEETPTHMSIKLNRLEEGHNSYPLVCRRPAEKCPSKGDKYVIDEELQHTDHLFLGVACFTFLNFV